MAKRRIKRRRLHSREFKIEAVRLSEDPERSVGEVADSLGIHRSLLQTWRKKFLGVGLQPDPDASRVETDAEANKRLRKELAAAKQDLEILKKAAAYFAKHQS